MIRGIKMIIHLYNSCLTKWIENQLSRLKFKVYVSDDFRDEVISAHCNKFTAVDENDIGCTFPV